MGLVNDQNETMKYSVSLRHLLIKNRFTLSLSQTFDTRQVGFMINSQFIYLEQSMAQIPDLSQELVYPHTFHSFAMIINSPKIV